MMTTLTSTFSWMAVAISWMHIWKEPSPVTQITVRSGCALAAPMAAGKP